MTAKQTTDTTDTPVEVVAEMPTNVISAIARVMAEIGGIRKLSPQQRKALGMGGGDAEGIKYSYRGIDQLAQAAQPLFGKYGVVIVPNVLDTGIEKIVKGNATMETTTWTRTTVEVEWTLYGPGGMDDKIVTMLIGVGDDNVDKGINKAMTASFKNLLLRILCIGDPQDDPDGHGGNEDQRGEPDDARGERDPGAVLFEYIRDTPDVKLKALLRQFAVDNSKALSGKALIDDKEWAALVQDAINGYLERQAQDADADQPQVPPVNDKPITDGVNSGDAALDVAVQDAVTSDPGKVKLGGAAKRGAQPKGDAVASEAVDKVNEAFPGTTEVKPDA